MLDKLKNVTYGAIPASPEARDWIFGGFGAGETFKPILGSKDWRAYRPSLERQNSVYFDTMSCVSFSALNVIETLFNYHLTHNHFSRAQLDFLNELGYIKDSKVNFSDRFIAKLSGTTRQGNTGRNVAEAIRHYGLVPEHMWDYPVKQRTPVFGWDEYYKEVPEPVLEVGRKFKQFFQINFETVWRHQFKDALEFSPVQVFVNAWYKNDDGVYYNPEKGKINHAVISDNLENEIFDSYEPYTKRLTPDYSYYPTGYIYAITNLVNDNMLDLSKFENYLIQLGEGKGGVGIVAKDANGVHKLLTDPNEGKVLLTWHQRNKDNPNYMLEHKETFSLADWNSVPHYNLSWQKVDTLVGGLNINNNKNSIMKKVLIAIATLAVVGVLGFVLLGGESSFGGTTNFDSLGLSENLSVDGNTTITGNETVGGTLGVTGDTTLSSDLFVKDTASSTAVIGNTSASGGLGKGCIKLGDSGGATSTPVYITASGATVTATTTRPAACSSAIE